MIIDTERSSTTPTRGYVLVGADQVYRVAQPAAGEPVGRALLVGSALSERGYAYHTWNRWGDRLARSGFHVVRFDYRGVGESSGDFEQLQWRDFLDDARACLELTSPAPRMPLLVHGVRFGGLVAAHLFASGIGDALLLWDPPEAGRAMTEEWLRVRLAEDTAICDGSPRRTRRELLAALERGHAIDLGGYRVSSRLWRELQGVAFPESVRADTRPVHIIRLSRNARAAPGTSVVRIPMPPFWRPGPVLVPDLSELFQLSADWARRAVGPSVEE